MMRPSQPLPPLWWFKFASVLCALFFGLFYTLPSFLPSDAQSSGKFTQILGHFLPDRKINLGLDLKGGLSLTLNVEVDSAVKDSVASSLARAKEAALQAGLSVTSFEVNSNLSTKVLFSKPEDKDAIQKKVLEHTNLILFNRVESGALLFEAHKTLVDDYRTQLMQQAINTIRNRIDQFGVAEPNIFQAGSERIVVELPGMTDIDRAKQLLGNTAKLDFRMVLNAVAPAELVDLMKQARTALNIPEDDVQPPTIEKISTWLRDSKKIPESSTILLSRTFGQDAQAGKVVSSVPLLVEAHPKLTGDLIENAQAGQSTDDYVPQYVVTLKFKPLGGKIFGDLTTEAFKPENNPHKIAIVLDGNVQSDPVVNGPITGGSAQITMGRFGGSERQLKDAQDLALVLRAGALPASVKVVEERQIGPSEGAQNIRSGVISTSIAAAIVIVLMLVIYGMSGLVANLAMILNVLMILAFMALFGATLTLPGIAGIVLTMAIAVDGNVVINERIREEIRSGLTQKQAFYKGYDTSFKTLIDAHITSAVAGLVLVAFGNPTVKGFAVTLLCGIICTLFTSYYVTEVIGQWLIEKTQIKRFG